MNPPPRRAGYRVDLGGHMARCEANYRDVLQLLPGLEARPLRRRFNLPRGGVLSLSTVEQNPYTSTLEVTFPVHWGVAPLLRVQVYHDAALAEVVAWSRHRRPAPRYDYPNAAMFQRDEKRQWNAFLGEWLDYCLQLQERQCGEPAEDCEL